MLSVFWGLIACTPTGTEGSAGPQEGPKEEESLQILSTNYPSHDLALRIAPPGTEMRCLLPPGKSAAHWKPSPEQISELAEADLILAQGMGYETWLDLASLPSDRLVLTAADIEPVLLASSTHSHGEDGEHSHGEKASHSSLALSALSLALVLVLRTLHVVAANTAQV